MVKNPPVNAGDTGSIPSPGRSPGEGNGNPLQYYCLGNPMDRGAWQAKVHGAAKELDTDLITKQQHNKHSVHNRDFLPRPRTLCGWKKRYLGSGPLVTLGTGISGSCGFSMHQFPQILNL